MLRPGIVGMPGSMVIRLRPCIISITYLLSSAPPPPSLAVSMPPSLSQISLSTSPPLPPTTPFSPSLSARLSSANSLPPACFSFSLARCRLISRSLHQTPPRLSVLPRLVLIVPDSKENTDRGRRTERGTRLYTPPHKRRNTR